MIGIDLGTYIAVFLGLMLFGISYNAFVTHIEHKSEGYMSLIVAAGVLVTLIGVSILSIKAALLALGAFIATGTPMIIGSITRYIQKREAALKAIKEELKHDEKSSLAE
jgi:ACR3 family arsenite efflux pump ArsB